MKEYKPSKRMTNWPEMPDKEVLERFKSCLTPIKSLNHRAIKKRNGQRVKLEEIILERMRGSNEKTQYGKGGS